MLNVGLYVSIYMAPPHGNNILILNNSIRRRKNPAISQKYGRIYFGKVIHFQILVLDVQQFVFSSLQQGVV